MYFHCQKFSVSFLDASQYQTSAKRFKVLTKNIYISEHEIIILFIKQNNA